MTAYNTMNGDLPTAEVPPPEPNVLYTAAYTIIDLVVFIVASIGYIIQDIFYIIFGYPEKDILNEVTLVTGGGSGIGRRLSQRLSEMGAKIVIWDINQEGINETVRLIEESGGYCKGYVVDISNKEQVYKAAKVVQREVGDVTILINNAGVVSARLLMDTPDHLIERSFSVNVLAHFWTTKAFLPKMIEKDRGHIVTIASMAGHVGIPKLVDYCASKFAAVGFDEALRLELDVLGHQGVKTTCICPFFIQSTGMFEVVNARWIPILDPNDVVERIIRAIKISEKAVIIPSYIKILLTVKWIFPWGCNAGFLRRLVPDAAPHAPSTNSTISVPNDFNHNDSNYNITEKNTKLDGITNLSGSDEDLIKSTASLLVKRSPSLGERVL